jgi:hypothetical protein
MNQTQRPERPRRKAVVDLKVTEFVDTVTVLPPPSSGGGDQTNQAPGATAGAKRVA